MHTSAAILSIGDELVLGQKLDTNAHWLAQQLTARGVPVAEHVTIADNLAQHASALRRLADSHPLVISTGGLGPTLDDLTRQALANLLQEDLVEDQAALEHLRALFASRGRRLTDLQRTQALRPRSARCIENPFGTAPGLHARANDTDIFCLPGPPREMQPMYERVVAPALNPARTIETRALHCLGIGEGDLATRLGTLMDRARNPLVGTTASGGIVSIRIRAESSLPAQEEPASDESSTETRMTADLQQTVEACRAAADPFVFGEDDMTIQSVVLDCLKIRGERLAVAESCTAGGLAALFSEAPGASAVFVGGWITYSNEMKAATLGVPGPLIARHGAVSAEVAAAMAQGALRAAEPAGGAHHALAITGIAGPDGGTPDKPAGTVFIAHAAASPKMQGQDSSPIADVRRFLITGDRHAVRDRSAKLALMMLRFNLLNLDAPRTLWQIQLDGSPLSAR